MSFAIHLETLAWNRNKTLATLEAIAKMPDPRAVLAYRPGPGRAHIAWQLMHIAATDDRHVHARMQAGQPQEPEYVRRFAGGSTPDEDIPSVDEIRRYLDAQRQELVAHLKTLDDSALMTKPNEQAPWTYNEWMRVLAWHEAHHQGQAHLSLNMYKAANGIK
jgi:uncharacterized damage-inducible protein DinB